VTPVVLGRIEDLTAGALALLLKRRLRDPYWQDRSTSI
jgi:hypothetical protein